AIIPGVSRSGVTMTAGLLTGMTREAAARFSFLLSAPLVFGAALYKLKDIRPADVNLPFLVGIGASAVVGALAIGFLLRYLRRESFALFVWYRVVIAAVILAVFWFRG
ncbi:MAG: UDP-diphosphatase, partial [Actinobacteria bacterium]|nr:UDP-diphosphatase [Actinomycetota bacterium]